MSSEASALRKMGSDVLYINLPGAGSVLPPAAAMSARQASVMAAARQWREIVLTRSTTLHEHTPRAGRAPSAHLPPAVCENHVPVSLWGVHWPERGTAVVPRREDLRLGLGSGLQGFKDFMGQGGVGGSRVGDHRLP